jgi:Short C-terminal domain
MLARRGPGLVGMAARTAVVAGTATAVSGRVQRRQADKYAEQDAEYMQTQAAAMAQGADQATASAPAGGDYTAQLQELAQLKDQGILTEEEFEAKKKQILGI